MSANKFVALARPAPALSVRLRLSEVAALVHGQLVGDEDPWITGLAGIHDAVEGDLTFLAQRRYRAALKHSRAAAVLVTPQESVDRPAVRVGDPALAFSLVLRRFSEATALSIPRGIHPTAVIDPSVRLGDEVAIGAHVVLESGVEIGDRATLLPGTVLRRDSRLGADCFIHPNVTIYPSTRIGDRVIVQAGAVIGSDGFGYVREHDTLHKVPHLGHVVIEDDVEIGANACIDRATTGTTTIGRGTKIDNLVQIAHNVKIGRTSVLCAQVGISGSTEIGAGVKLAGQAGVVGHIHIGDGAVIGAQSGVIGSVPAATTVSGYPARPHLKELRQRAVMARLPELLDTIRALEKRLEALERGNAGGERPS
ncbi:MAG TPA: UDP-3-O-(3-hydroxymyristoyl)glucosamine N-acyltransferase [Candidatus Krumholzibacteria bacterium]|nr:UDP-3-O-(3-hydroxymyristoyl)glucosamine N-acyltransferase [Candidatus Krumholzibacteria bacterium]